MSSTTEPDQPRETTSDSDDNAELMQTKVVQLLEDMIVPSFESTSASEVPDGSVHRSEEDPTSDPPLDSVVSEDSREHNKQDDEEDTASSEDETLSADAVSEEMPASAVRIKGRAGGVLIEIGEGEWADLMLVLGERLETAEGFFRGGRVVLDLGSRLLVKEDFIQLSRILAGHEMRLGIVRSDEARTIQIAVNMGLATSTDEADPVQVVEVRPAPSAKNQPPYFVHRGSLRSGQVLRKAESIVILGDVNPGAQVISAGDIMVWGRLRGVAYAGDDENKDAVIAALQFAPTQLRIATFTAIAPEQKKASRGFLFWKKDEENRPEVAHVADGQIVVEPWDDSRPGRPTDLRRK